MASGTVGAAASAATKRAVFKDYNIISNGKVLSIDITDMKPVKNVSFKQLRAH